MQKGAQSEKKNNKVYSLILKGLQVHGYFCLEALFNYK